MPDRRSSDPRLRAAITRSTSWWVEFALVESAGAASGDHTQMAFEVDDIEATVRDLRGRGVTFEEYDLLPGLTTVAGIEEVEGNYPSKGAVGERAAWFHDNEGNLLAVGQRCAQ
jgi:hypothetical protein